MAIGASLGDISRLLALAGVAIAASGLWWSLLILLYGVFLRRFWRTPPSYLNLPRPLRRAAYHFLLGAMAALPLALIRAVQLLASTAPVELTQRVILQTAIAAFPNFVMPYFWVWWIVAAYSYHWFLPPRGRSSGDVDDGTGRARTTGQRSAGFSDYAADVEYALEELRRELEQRDRQTVSADPPDGNEPANESPSDLPPAIAADRDGSADRSSNASMLAMLAASLVLGLGVLFLLATVLLLPFPDVNLPFPGIPRPATATVVSVGDGDTLRVDRAGRRLTIRLACIDAPESAQPGGAESTAYLRQLLPAGQMVGVRQVDIDFFGRTVAELYRNGASVSVAMVQAGHAVVYPRYLDGCPMSRVALLAAEAEAKAARRNFWSQPNPEMPWDWRRRNRRRRRRAASPSGAAQEMAADRVAGDRTLVIG